MSGTGDKSSNKRKADANQGTAMQAVQPGPGPSLKPVKFARKTLMDLQKADTGSVKIGNLEPGKRKMEPLIVRVIEKRESDRLVTFGVMDETGKCQLKIFKDMAGFIAEKFNDIKKGAVYELKSYDVQKGFDEGKLDVVLGYSASIKELIRLDFVNVEGPRFVVADDIDSVNDGDRIDFLGIVVSTKDDTATETRQKIQVSGKGLLLIEVVFWGAATAQIAKLECNTPVLIKNANKSSFKFQPSVNVNPGTIVEANVCTEEAKKLLNEFMETAKAKGLQIMPEENATHSEENAAIAEESVLKDEENIGKAN